MTRWPAMNGRRDDDHANSPWRWRVARARWARRTGGRRAHRARAAVAQQRERVVAGVVAVAPGRADGVAADELDVDEPGLLVGERRRRVQPAGQARLAAAVRAGAQPAQRARVVGGPVAVGPVDRRVPAARSAWIPVGVALGAPDEIGVVTLRIVARPVPARIVPDGTWRIGADRGSCGHAPELPGVLAARRARTAGCGGCRPSGGRPADRTRIRRGCAARRADRPQRAGAAEADERLAARRRGGHRAVRAAAPRGGRRGGAARRGPRRAARARRPDPDRRRGRHHRVPRRAGARGAPRGQRTDWPASGATGRSRRSPPRASSRATSSCCRAATSCRPTSA